MGPWFKSAFSGTWLFAGLGLGALGVSYLASAVAIAVLLSMRPEHLPPCPRPTPGAFIQECSNNVPIMQGRALAGLAPAPRRFPVLAAPLFVLAGLAVYTTLPGKNFFDPQRAPCEVPKH